MSCTIGMVLQYGIALLNIYYEDFNFQHVLLKKAVLILCRFDAPKG